MFARLLVAAFFAVQSFCVHSNEFTLPEWYVSNAKDYLEKLKKMKPAPSAEAAAKAAHKAAQENRWEVAMAEMESAVAKDPESVPYWVEYAQISITASVNSNNNYDFRNKAQKAATLVYMKSKAPEDRARALIILAATSYGDEMVEGFLYELTTLTSLPNLRKSYPEYANLLPFEFKDKEVRRDGKKPSLSLSFTHSLPKDFKPQDYIDIRPKVDGAFSVRKNEIILSGLKYGESYSIRVKEGVPSRFGEKTKQNTDISVIVDERNAHLAFPVPTYIMRKDEDLHLPLTAVNIKRVTVEAYRINPRAFVEGFRRRNQSLDSGIESYSTEEMSQRYGETIYEGKMDVGGERNASVVKQIPLKTIIKDIQPGAYGIMIHEDATGSNVSPVSQWVLITDIGLTMFKGTSGLDVNVRSLDSAQPMSDVELQLISANNQIITTKKSTKGGWVHFEDSLLAGKGGNRPYYIFATGSEGSFTVQKLNEPAFDLADRGSGGRKIPGVMDAFLYSERGIYRPGESIRVNTLLRDFQAKSIPGVPLTFKFFRPDDQVAASTLVKGNDLGFYEVTFPLSSSARTGKWIVRVYADPTKDPLGDLSITVEDFVPSRLLVTLNSKEKILTAQKPVEVDLYARYLFGAKAPLLTGEAHMTLGKNPNPFPKFEDYAFGLLDDDFTDKREDLAFTALDAEGKAKFTVSLEPTVRTSLPLQATIKAEVNDIGGRPRHATHKLTVQLTPALIGLKSAAESSSFPMDSKKAQINVIAVNAQGDLVLSALEGKLYREEVYYDWSNTTGLWSYKPVREDHFVQDIAITTQIDKPAVVEVPIEEWGFYRLEVRDPKTGAASSYRFTKGYISSESETRSPDQLSLTLNKKSYQAGETVQVQINAPFDGEGVLVVANESVLHTENIQIKKNGTSYNVKASADWGAGAYVMVSAVRPLKAPKTASIEHNLLPKRAIGLAWMALDPEPRTLKVEMTLPAEVKPRQSLVIPMDIKGAKTKNTVLTLAAVDEGILMLTDFITPKPQDHFLAKRMLGVEVRDVYGKIMNAEPGDVGILRSGGDSGALERNLAALSKRSFRIVSLYKGPILVDESGKAQVTVDLPDFNGTLRLMAVAHNEDSVGNGEAKLLVRDPIVVEAVLPRFLAPGDSSLITLSLHNNLKEKKDVKLTTTATGSVEIEQKPIQVGVDPDGEAQQQLKLVGKSVGDGKVIVSLSAPGLETVTRVFEISCRSVSSPITRRESYYINPGEGMIVKPASYQDLDTQGREVQVMVSDRLAWDMAAIAKELVNYPYGCVEQTTSRAFGLLYKKANSILDKEETVEDVDRAIQKGIVALSDKQLSSGGFPFWSSTGDEDVWVTAFAYDMMKEAKKNKVSIPDAMTDTAANWLRHHVKSRSSSHTDAELSAAAYALFLLARDEQIEDGAVRYFYDTFYPRLSQVLGRVFVASALVQIGDINRAKRALGDLVPANKEPANRMPFGSEIRNQAAIVWALSEAAKVAPTLPELATMAHRSLLSLREIYRGSKYLSTQDNAWLIRAGLATPETRTDGHSLAQIQGKDQEIKGTFQHNYSPQELANPVTVNNVGDKPLWVTALTAGTPQNPQPAESHGLKVGRTYYRLDGKEVAQGSLKQGDQLVVVLDVALDAQDEMPRHYLVIADLFPAGLEYEGGPLPTSEKETYPWAKLPSPMISQGRDDRYISAVTLSSETSKFRVAYRVRAITPGHYVHPGLFVEDMYKPSLYARTAVGSMTIAPK